MNGIEHRPGGDDELGIIISLSIAVGMLVGALVAVGM